MKKKSQFEKKVPAFSYEEKKNNLENVFTKHFLFFLSHQMNKKISTNILISN